MIVNRCLVTPFACRSVSFACLCDAWRTIKCTHQYCSAGVRPMGQAQWGCTTPHAKLSLRAGTHVVKQESLFGSGVCSLRSKMIWCVAASSALAHHAVHAPEFVPDLRGGCLMLARYGWLTIISTTCFKSPYIGPNRDPRGSRNSRNNSQVAPRTHRTVPWRMLSHKRLLL